jgi:hypothetical protein
VRIKDVVRAALGEVEDYHRVTAHGVEPATVLGSAAADLAHLIAELLENALTFSPPDQRVHVRGRRRRDGYELAIVDAGLGMAPTDLERANRRLAGIESFTVAPSKYLGHYVAGNLASRHGIGIRLDPTPGRGITASIDLPPHLLTSPDPPPPPPASPISLTPPQHLATWEPRPIPALAKHGLERGRPGGRPCPAVLSDDLLVALGRRLPGRVEVATPRPDAGEHHVATTDGGLARRTPGAQIPATEPRPLRRGTASRRTEPASAAQDVYGFLTDFAAGRQRGLDEARGAAD